MMIPTKNKTKKIVTVPWCARHGELVRALTTMLIHCVFWTGNPSLCKSGCQVNETPGYAPANPSSGGGYTPAYVTTSTRRSGSKKSKTPVIVGTTIPSFIIFWAIVGFVVVLRKRRTAAVAAAIAGGANRPNGKPHSGQLRK